MNIVSLVNTVIIVSLFLISIGVFSLVDYLKKIANESKRIADALERISNQQE